MWQLRQERQTQQSDEVRQTERVQLESFRLRRLLIVLAMLVMGTLGGLAGSRFIAPPSYLATGISAVGGIALTLLLIVIPRQALRVLLRAVIALGLLWQRRRLRALVRGTRGTLLRGGAEELAPDRLGDLAVAEFLRGSLEAAEAHLAQALELAPDQGCLINNLGVVLAQQGHHERAVELFSEPLEGCAEERSLNCALVAPLLSSPAALERLSRDGDSHSAIGCNNIGVCYARHGDWAAASLWFARASELTPRLPAACANVGLVAYRAGQLQDAADQVLTANRLAPNEPTFANYLGVILATAGQLDQAHFYLRRAHRVDPASVPVRINSVAAEAQRGHWHVAEKGFRALLGVEDHLADVQFDLAVAQLANQDAGAAALSAAAAIAAGDSSSDAYTVLAVALWDLGRRAEALSHFGAATSAPGAGPAAASNLARALLLEGQLERATTLLEQARSQWPEDPALEFDHATALLAIATAGYDERLPLAERQTVLAAAQRSCSSLERAIARNGDTALEAHVNLGLYLYMQEQYETAAEHFEAALRLDPRLHEVQFMVGTALGREGERHTLRTEDGDSAPTPAGRQCLRRAVPYLEAATESREVLVPASYNLARCLYVLKEYERALAAVRKALRLESDGELNALAALAAAREAQKVQLLFRTQLLSDARRDQLRLRSLELLNVAVHYFRQALLRDEHDATLHGNLGIAYMLRNREQDVEAALRHWERMRAIGGGAAERRYAELSQMDNLSDPSRVGFDDRNAKLQGIPVSRWLVVPPPRPPGLRFIIAPVPVQLPWRLAAGDERLQAALLLRDRQAADELRLARLRV